MYVEADRIVVSVFIVPVFQTLPVFSRLPAVSELLALTSCSSVSTVTIFSATMSDERLALS